MVFRVPLLGDDVPQYTPIYPWVVYNPRKKLHNLPHFLTSPSISHAASSVSPSPAAPHARRAGRPQPIAVVSIVKKILCIHIPYMYINMHYVVLYIYKYA